MNINILHVVDLILLIAAFFLLAMITTSVAVDHCDNCPGVECLCIQDVDGNWMLSPEVGE